MGGIGSSGGSAKTVCHWAEPCPSCDGSGESPPAETINLAPRTGDASPSACPDCGGIGVQMPAGWSEPVDREPLRENARVVETMEFLAGDRRQRVELIRGPGGEESLRLTAYDRKNGRVVPMIIDEPLAHFLRKVLSGKPYGGIQRLMDAISQSWSPSSAAAGVRARGFRP